MFVRYEIIEQLSERFIARQEVFIIIKHRIDVHDEG